MKAKIKRMIKNMILDAALIGVVYSIGFIAGGKRVADKAFELTDLKDITIKILGNGDSTLTFPRKTN